VDGRKDDEYSLARSKYLTADVIKALWERESL
jgi:hypothetical protein